MNVLNIDTTPSEIKKIKEWFEWFGLLSPTGLIAAIFLILLVLYFWRPEVLGRIRLFFVGIFVVFKWARKEKVKRTLEIDIVSDSKKINKEIGIELLSFEPDIKWVGRTTREEFIKGNKVVIRLDYHDDKNRTYALAAFGFVRKSLLHVSKRYMPEEVIESSNQYNRIKVGDRLVCNVLSPTGVIPVEHIITKIDFLEMHGIRIDINKEVEILGSSILEHKPSNNSDSYV